jgi:hypothetical protein
MTYQKVIISLLLMAALAPDRIIMAENAKPNLTTSQMGGGV